MSDGPIQRVVISTMAILRILSHIKRFNIIQQGSEIKGSNVVQQGSDIKGCIIGYRSEDVLHIRNVIPISHSVKEVPSSDNDLDDRLDEISQRIESKVLGWYHAYPNMDLSFSKESKVTQRIVMKSFPGAVVLVVDSAKFIVRNELKSSMKVFTLNGNSSMVGDKEMKPVIEIRDIELRTSLREAFRNTSRIIDRNLQGYPPVFEYKEKRKQANGQTSSKNTKLRSSTKNQEQPRSDLERIDALSIKVVSLKDGLGKLKHSIDSHDPGDPQLFTKKARSLKVMQLDLFDHINKGIKNCENVQYKIAFYKIRDSLSMDMKLLDDMINDQYIETLTGLLKMEPSSNQ